MRGIQMVLFGLLAISLVAGAYAHNKQSSQDYQGDYTDYTDCTDGSFQTEVGLRYVGATLVARRRASSLDSCTQACDSNADCNSFNFVRSLRRCYMYSETDAELDTVKSVSTIIGYWSCGNGDYADVTYTDNNSGNSSGNANGNKSGGNSQGDK